MFMVLTSHAVNHRLVPLNHRQQGRLIPVISPAKLPMAALQLEMSSQSSKNSKAWALKKSAPKKTRLAVCAPLMVSYGSAAISVCGPMGITTWCYLAAQWALDIQNACLNSGRVGEQITFFNTNTIEVIHCEQTSNLCGREIRSC